ncbi:MAG: pyridoxal-phosphate dependent enzyme [bacterium]
MGRIYDDITLTIGRTPLVRLNRVTAEVKATVLAKLEFFNPLSSVKDPAGLAMIEEAEARGVLGPDTVPVEATSGNTGIALAFAAGREGLPAHPHHARDHVGGAPRAAGRPRRRAGADPGRHGMQGRSIGPASWRERCPKP